MLLRSLELSVEISETVSLPLSLHCCSSPRMKTGVHLNTSPAGIVCVAVALLCVTVVTVLELLLATLVRMEEAGSIITISAPENFCANESMFLLKVSLRSGLRPNRIGFADNFDFEYKFSVCEETARAAVVDDDAATDGFVSAT